jgi:lipoyl(octanoyl) transferase
VNVNINRDTKFIDLGLIDYKQAWDYQTELFNGILEVKAANRNRPGEEEKTSNYLLFCEHPHVFTLGKSGEVKNLLVKPEELHSINATYYHINRGGDITYHGPGQLVVYPVIDMENFFTDIHKYMRLLEESVILTLKDFGISGHRIPGLTGVWLDVEKEPRKICALGVKTSRWVTMHGLAFNVNVDLNYFNHIVPCGIEDKGVTSMEKELSGRLPISDIKEKMKAHLRSLFNMELTK